MSFAASQHKFTHKNGNFTTNRQKNLKKII